MITYELVKQLKDAGYRFKPMSQADAQVSELRARQIDFGEYKEYIRYVLSPTLSELVEACGEGFGLLLRTTKENWCAGNSCDQHGEIRVPRGFGSTPEEAVAKLWLELNKK